MLVIAAALASSAATDGVRLDPQLQDFLDAKFQVVTNTSDIPHYIFKSFNRNAHLSKKDIANPNERFNATDIPNGFPNARLIMAGQSDQQYFIFYEEGGIGYHTGIVLFLSDGESAAMVWQGVGSQRIESIEALKQRIRDGEFTKVPEHDSEQ